MSMFNDIVWDAKGNDEFCENNSKTIKKSMLKDPLAVIGLSLGLDLKRSGTELTIANQMDLGTELQRKCCSTSQDRVILCSVVAVPWREENSEAKMEERHQYTSITVRKTLSCFSRWSSPSISTVCMEQQRI